jgi:membrane associated rhomboid family serine protease
LIIPWRVDVPQERLPLANWLLIAIIIGFFVWQIIQVENYHQNLQGELNRVSAEQKDNNNNIQIDLFKGLVLKGWTIRGLLGHMWLHGGWIHLIGNMLFLWIFGNAVCAKLGHITFTLIYLTLGVVAGITHLLVTSQPVIGASGAINGIVGMYLVFFPTNSITCLFLFMFPFYWKIFEVSSYVMILLWFTFDILGAAMGGGHTAYFAHIGGFATGFIIAIILLKTKLIKMTRYEKSIFDIISDARLKPEVKEPYYRRVLTQDYLISDKKPTTEKIPADTAGETKQALQSPLSVDDFFRQSESKAESSPQQSNAGINDGFIRFYCNCGKRHKVSVEYAGKTGKCPQCKQPVKIPKPD